jgi:hypothetical protein
MHQRKRLALAAAGVLVVAGVLGGLWLSGDRGQDRADGAATTGHAATTPDVALPVPSSFPTASAGTTTPAAGRSTDPVAVGTEVLEPGPDAPVATDRPATSAGRVVVVTYADWVDGGVEVDGYVSGSVEDGGTCRLTLTQGNQVRTAEGAGMADASTTSCGSLVVPGGGLPAGDWDAVLAYLSGGSTTTSERAVVTVPAR